MNDISVIIPTKDRLWSLPKAVASCHSSQLKVEIIVIDDASTDGTADWLRNQPGVIAIPGEGWGKPSGVNKALETATGDFVRFLDSDDWLNPRANELQFEIARQTNADVVVAGMDIYHDDTLADSLPWVPTDDFIAQQLGEAFGSHYSAFLFRRAFIHGIPHRTLFPASDFASRDDRCFMLEVAIRNPSIAVSREPALCHRHHAKARLQFRGGLGGVGMHIQQLYIYRQILRLLDERGELTLRRKQAAIKVLWPLAHWIAYTHLEAAYEVVDWIFRLDPEFRAPERGLLGVLYRTCGFRLTERVLALRRSMVRYVRSVTLPQ
ncbi:MAG: glycosyltransferase family 2 protein [Candidatus Binatia bacterium]